MSEPEFLAPTRLAEATEILAGHGGDAKVLGGGTALMPLMRQRLTRPRVLLSLHRVPGLSEVNDHGTGLRIGAQATLRTLETSPAARGLIPGLADALAGIGIVRIRNQATVGGTLACGDPRLDLPAILMALDAEVRLVSSRGERTIAFTGFYPGDRTLAAGPDEIIAEVHVPVPPPGSAMAYLKYLPSGAAGYPLVGVAARLVLDDAGERITDARLALAGCAPTTVSVPAVQELLHGRRPTEAAFADAAAAVQSEISPESDSRGTAEYQRGMAEVVTRRALVQALERARN
jgi:carbon-monoxide dehydrogenase medium subunit